MQTFTKSSDNNQGEAAGLTWLAEAEATGGARVPQVMHADTSRLEIEYIHSVKPSVSGARKFGEALAHACAWSSLVGEPANALARTGACGKLPYTSCAG